MEKTIILTGGGTGGHIYPNLALVGGLKSFCRVCYVGCTGGMEEKLCRENGIEFFGISAPKFQRKFTLENAKLPFAIASSVKEGKELISRLSPAVIFSKGGYVSLPICLAGLSLGVPVLCHESDFSVGLANKIVHAKGGTLLTSFAPTMQNKKRVICVGSPIRQELTRKQSEGSNRDTQRHLLIIGGSQGAKAINESVIENLDKLTQNYIITHITGVGKLTEEKEIARHFESLSQHQLEEMFTRYNQIEYATNMAKIYQTADIAISRGGANALFELLQFEIPTLVIPLEKASRGDQVENANFFSRNKLCHTLSENNLFALFESVTSLDKNAKQISQNISQYKLHHNFDGRENIIKLILSHC